MDHTYQAWVAVCLYISSHSSEYSRKIYIYNNLSYIYIFFIILIQYILITDFVIVFGKFSTFLLLLVCTSNSACTNSGNIGTATCVSNNCVCNYGTYVSGIGCGIL